VLSGRGLSDELITRPEESYRLWYVVVCDLETSRIGAPYIYTYIYIYDISSLRVNNCSNVMFQLIILNPLPVHVKYSYIPLVQTARALCLQFKGIRWVLR